MQFMSEVTLKGWLKIFLIPKAAKYLRPVLCLGIVVCFIEYVDNLQVQ